MAEHPRWRARAPKAVTSPVVNCTGQRARELVARNEGERDALPLLVSDRITAEGRTILTEAGWSWLDQRGRLHLRGPGIRVDVDVDVPGQGDGERLRPPDPPISGRSGIAVAYWLCAHPGRALSPTRNATELRLAPSTISSVNRRLAESSLLDNGAGLFPELFWELAGVWKAKRTWLNTVPDPAVLSRANLGEATWRRTGTAAAAAYGAPMASSADQPVELYVPAPVDLSIASRRYGIAAAGFGPASLAVAPTPAVAVGPGEDRPVELDGWPLAPILAVALDLAQDRARGREILTEWTRSNAVWR